MTPTTAILLNYRRPYNLPPIVQTLRQTDWIGEILIWNNGPAVEFGPDVAQFGDGFNRGLLPRLALAPLARHRTILFQDDDLLLTRAQLEQFGQAYHEQPWRRICGVQGRRLTDQKRYCGGNTFGPCDIVNQAVLFDRADASAALRYLPSPFWSAGGVDWMEDDILLSLAFGRDRCRAIDVGPLERRDAYSAMAWSARPDHADRRQRAVEWMLERIPA